MTKQKLEEKFDKVINIAKCEYKHPVFSEQGKETIYLIKARKKFLQFINSNYIPKAEVEKIRKVEREKLRKLIRVEAKMNYDRPTIVIENMLTFLNSTN